MLSAEVATQGRTLPLYRDVFEERTQRSGKRIYSQTIRLSTRRTGISLIIMDAAFGDNWFEAIESQKWYWLVRARGGKYIKLSDGAQWQEASELFNPIGTRAKCYEVVS